MTSHDFKREEFIVEKMREADRDGADIAASRPYLMRMAVEKFGSCHSCLLLAVYGLYKNGFIADSSRTKAKRIDLTGFDGRESACIRHAFDSLELLMKDATLSGSYLKQRLGGDGSIYSFVGRYFREGLLRL